MSEDLYYLQDSRQYVGNDMLFWKVDGNGYTTDIRQARVCSKEEAVRLHRHRGSDIPWPKDYIDARVRPAVDVQNVDKVEALKKTGIVLTKPSRPKKQRGRCGGCGQFITERARWQGPHSCGANNTP